MTTDLPSALNNPMESVSRLPEIDQAVQTLSAGGLVAFPTETVYGLGADAENDEAVRGIFAAKGRPPSHPLIMHVSSAAAIERYARDIPNDVWKIAESFWPGPLTLILKRNSNVSDLVTGGQDTVGLRMPSHPVAQDLLGAFGRAIAAPSANRFGRISPTTAAHVATELGGKVDQILDGGFCTVGLESTILDLSDTRPALLRPGAITPTMLAEVLGELPVSVSADRPRVPGQMASHYAPRTPVHLVGPEALADLSQWRTRTGTVAIMALRPPPAALSSDICWKTMPTGRGDYARNLYASLREMDDEGHTCLLVERPTPEPEWAAVLDRLERAAH